MAVGGCKSDDVNTKKSRHDWFRYIGCGDVYT